jgi:hypothetical protein
MFSVETNSISFIGLAIDGVYSIIKVPSELCNCFGDVGLRSSKTYQLCALILFASKSAHSKVYFD